MITKGIKVFWEGGIEYIELDLDDLDHIEPIQSTIEWWPSEKRWAKYNTAFNFKKVNNTSFEVYLDYEMGSNPHLDPNEVCFGTSTIFITPGQASGKAVWVDFNYPSSNGPAKWERVDSPLIGERKRERVSRIQREQQIFRSALIALDQKCVLSGEATVEALEAAHIIPASKGGAEVIENGIVLRADIHRLFDAGLFSIDYDGSVIVASELKESYAESLSKMRIPEKTLKRILPALKILNSSVKSTI